MIPLTINEATPEVEVDSYKVNVDENVIDSFEIEGPPPVEVPVI